MDGASRYILHCRDGKIYTGEHAQGLSDFTRSRRLVELIFSEAPTRSS